MENFRNRDRISTYSFDAMDIELKNKLNRSCFYESENDLGAIAFFFESVEVKNDESERYVKLLLKIRGGTYFNKNTNASCELHGVLINVKIPLFVFHNESTMILGARIQTEDSVVIENPDSNYKIRNFTDRIILATLIRKLLVRERKMVQSFLFIVKCGSFNSNKMNALSIKDCRR